MEPGYGFHGSSSVQGLQSPVFARAPVPRPNRLRGAKNLAGRSVGINRRFFVYYRALLRLTRYFCGKSSVRLSVRDVEVSWSHKLELFENNLRLDSLGFSFSADLSSDRFKINMEYGREIGSPISCNWCQNQRPWMTLKGHCALSSNYVRHRVVSYLFSFSHSNCF